MGGHSLDVTSTNASSATPLVTHYRYQPVPSPVVVPTSPLGPGEAVLLMAVLNYQDGSAVNPNGRWLFPPKASQMLVEEHGMLDGYVAGKPPDFKAAPTAATYALLAAHPLTGRSRACPPPSRPLPRRAPRAVTRTSPSRRAARPPLCQRRGCPTRCRAGYFSRACRAPPISTPGRVSKALRPRPSGRERNCAGRGTVAPHARGRGAPHQRLHQSDGDGCSRGDGDAPPGGCGHHLCEQHPLAPRPEDPGPWSWILEVAPAAERAKLTKEAVAGLIWMLTPYRVLRLVHAVRKPLEAPRFRVPVVEPRTYGSVQATLRDSSFLMSASSTASIDVEATWKDPLDDPSDPSNDPATATVTTTQHAFKLVVPDPLPLGPWPEPMKVVAPVPRFPLYPGGGGAVHTVGDTKHHYVSYACTGTSRFVEFFRKTATMTFASSSPVTIDGLGLDPREVVLEDGSASPPYVLKQGVDYTVDAAKGQVSVLTSAYQNKALDVTWVPVDTERGAVRHVHVLASARPAAPKVVKVTPAWSLSGARGSLAGGGLSYTRTGGYLRVYLERPWFSSGAGELLGVVATVPGKPGITGGPFARERSQPGDDDGSRPDQRLEPEHELPRFTDVFHRHGESSESALPPPVHLAARIATRRGL